MEAPGRLTIHDPYASVDVDRRPQPAPADVADVDAYSVFAALWRQRELIARATVLGMILALLVALLLPNRYESVVRLMPPDQSSSTNLALMAAASTQMIGSPTLGSMAANLLGGSKNSALFIGVMGSRTVQDAIIDRFDLRSVYRVKTYKEAREKLEGNTDIVEDRKSGIVVLRVDDKDKYRAAGIAQAYVAQLNRAVVTLNTSSAHREREFLEQRLQAVKEDLDAATKALGQFSSKTLAFDPRDQGKAMLDATAELQAQLIAAKSELDGLRQIYSPGNVRVRTAEARVASVQAELNKLGGTSAVSESANIGNFQYPSIKQLPLLGTTYADLYRRAKIQEAAYEILTKQYEIAKIEEAKEIPSVKVLDPADVPEKKASPHRFLITLSGLLLSFICSVVFVIARETWEHVPEASPYKRMLRDMSSDPPSLWGAWRHRFRSKLRVSQQPRAGDGFLAPAGPSRHETPAGSENRRDEAN